MTAFDEIKQRDKQYFMNTYSPLDLAIESGDGCIVTDSEGKRYVDFLAGIAVACLGYNSPVFNKAITEQAAKMTVCSNYFYSKERALAAEALVRGTNLNKVFFANSGAEANECAIKLARRYAVEKNSGKFKIVSALDSFHGRTLATVTATGQAKYNKPFAPLPEGIGIYVPFNDIQALEVALSDKEVCAFLVEPIQGEGGVLPATKEYLAAARELTKKNGQLLILDEIQTGAGRSGTFWAFEQYGIQPDIVTCAKGIGGGFPIAGCMATDEVAAAWHAGDHGTTFGAAPLACAVSYAVVSELRKEGFLDSVREKGEYLKKKLKELNSSKVVDIRGMGLIVGMQFADDVNGKEIVHEMLNKGFIMNTCGKNTMRFVPPLIIEYAHIDAMVKAMGECLAK